MPILLTIIMALIKHFSHKQIFQILDPLINLAPADCQTNKALPSSLQLCTIFKQQFYNIKVCTLSNINTVTC